MKYMLARNALRDLIKHIEYRIDRVKFYGETATLEDIEYLLTQLNTVKKNLESCR